MGSRFRWLAGGPAIVLTAAAVAALAAAAEPDLSGSRDPHGVERYPRSWIVAYQDDTETRPREFVISRVDRIRRELRVADHIKVDGTAESVTYRIPEGVTVMEVADHYREQLGDDVLFQCGGRDCGRSNDWANQIFQEATLYGPDPGQRYIALEWQGALVSVYVIERGNKRVYAHLSFVEPAPGATVDANALLARRLAERGWAPVENLILDTDGSLNDAARSTLTELGGALDAFAGATVYLVCHLSGSATVDALLAASQRCAESGVGVLGAGRDPGMAPRLIPFGAGPLLPRQGLPGSRLEFVLPGRSRGRD